MDDPASRALADSWTAAIADGRISTALEAVYHDAARAIAARGPVCWASGRCCNFRRTGHRLYTTGLETAYCLVHLSDAESWRAANDEARTGLTIHGQPPDDPVDAPLPTGRGLRADLAAASSRGGCPFQVRNLCGVHRIKPLGCRVYFCDRSAQAWQQDLSERLLREIRAIHDRFNVEYRYGEWLAMLAMFDA